MNEEPLEQAFAPIAGNSAIKRYLSRLVRTKAVAHSWLFAGPEGVGKSLFAEAFAKLLLSGDSLLQMPKNHPDLHIYHPEGKLGMHSIDAMRQFAHEVYLSPYQAPWKVFIIHSAERMLTYSANALLKTFEEPPPSSILILLSGMPDLLLSTVRSRCRVLYFQPLSEKELSDLIQEKWGKSQKEASRVARLSHGSLKTASHWMNQEEASTRSQLLQFLSRGKITRYGELKEITQLLGKEIEESCKELESEIRNELLKQYPESPSSVQQQAIDKEAEGVAALSLLEQANESFQTILGWYRDMHLMAVNGAKNYLHHPEMEEACFQALQRGEILPLEHVQGAIERARLALTRSTPFTHCLEQVLLQTSFTQA